MKIGYTTWGMPDLPIDAALEHLARLGFTGVEPTVIPGYTTELDTLDPGERHRIRRLFDHHSLDMPAVAGHRSLLERDPGLHAENWRRLRGTVELCADWGRGGGVPVLDTTLGGRPPDWDGSEDFVLERLGELVDYGAGRGVTIAVEPHVGSALDLPSKALWLLRRIDSPYLKLNFDISHFDVLGLPVAETVAALAPHSAHTHVKDQRGRAPGHEFLIPGEGPFDFVSFLEEMGKAGYEGYITAEVSMMVQQRPGYDPLAAAALTFQTLDRAFARAGISR